MTKTLLVDAPTGEQRLLANVPAGTRYMELEPERTLWDTAVDGPLDPAIEVGGMVRQGGALVFNQARKDAHDAALAALAAPLVKRAAIAAAIEADPKWAALKDATNAQIDTWLTNNVTNLASARDVLGLVLKLLRDRLL